MADAKPTGIRARLEQLAARARDSLRLVDPGPEPGSKRWLAELHDDIGQAQRNETDCMYVVVRREARIRRAAEDDRWAEILALAEIESHAGRPERGHRRVTEALNARRIPQSTRGFVGGLVARLARARRADGNRGGARELFDTAKDVASDADDDALVVDVLLRRASFELETHAIELADVAIGEGLLRLGWGTGSDPYRKGPPRNTLDEWDRRALVSLVRMKVKCLGYAGAYDDARHLLAELRETLGDAAKASEQRVATDEAWLAYREGDFSDAARRWQELYAYFDGVQDQATAALTMLTNVGWALLRGGDPEAAADHAERLLARTDLDSGLRARNHGLAAEAALAQGDHPKAGRHAVACSDSEDAIGRTSALRVLAEVHLASADLDAALGHARRAVDESLVAFGRDLYAVDRLLTLVRVATQADPSLAKATLEEAAAIPVPDGHPLRAQIERARAELLS